ncbi:hypothetical protein [uncultured Tateyamaria sp.]|uniref:hypothetical protein n=1 Tax=uncultured Tateyamaria sp. TaxID=455651 RepID=UPI0026080DAB|nr:hypothetical protein [uncultured Tateyamaria sp.]
MDNDARLRLKAAIAVSGKTSKAISQEHGWPDNYVSRVVAGQIPNPSSDRLLSICKSANTDIVHILTGDTPTDDRVRLMEDIASAPSDVIDKVSAFVRSSKLFRDDD